MLGLLADRLEEEALRVVGADAGHALERLDLLLVGLRQVLAGLVEVAIALQELAVALLEHVGALVELLVAGEQAPLQRRELVALRPGLVLRLALQTQLLVLRLEDQLLLTGSCLGLDPARLGLGRLHRLGRVHAAQHHAEHESAERGNQRHRDDDRCLHLYLPSGARSAGGCSSVVGAVPRMRRHRPMGRSWAVTNADCLGRVARRRLLKSGA